MIQAILLILSFALWFVAGLSFGCMVSWRKAKKLIDAAYEDVKECRRILRDVQDGQIRKSLDAQMQKRLRDSFGEDY